MLPIAGVKKSSKVSAQFPVQELPCTNIKDFPAKEHLRSLDSPVEDRPFQDKVEHRRNGPLDLRTMVLGTRTC